MGKPFHETLPSVLLALADGMRGRREITPSDIGPFEAICDLGCFTRVPDHELQKLMEGVLAVRESLERFTAAQSLTLNANYYYISCALSKLATHYQTLITQHEQEVCSPVLPLQAGDMIRVEAVVAESGLYVLTATREGRRIPLHGKEERVEVRLIIGSNAGRVSHIPNMFWIASILAIGAGKNLSVKRAPQTDDQRPGVQIYEVIPKP